MLLSSTLTYKKIGAKVDYSQYSKPHPVRCPICCHYTPRSRKYETLKGLGHHLATDHKNDCPDPISVSDVHEVMKALAIAKQWGMFIE
jgi:hypothetical protein